LQRLVPFAAEEMLKRVQASEGKIPVETLKFVSDPHIYSDICELVCESVYDYLYNDGFLDLPGDWRARARCDRMMPMRFASTFIAAVCLILGLAASISSCSSDPPALPDSGTSMPDTSTPRDMSERVHAVRRGLSPAQARSDQLRRVRQSVQSR